MASLWNRAGHYIFALWFLSFFFLFFFFFPHLISAVGDWMSTILHTWCGLSANSECMSEMCCTWLAENTGSKDYTRNLHLRTIAQLCQAISLQLRYVSTIGKNLLNSSTSSTCPHSMANVGPLTAEIGLGVWGTPANFNRFRVLAALLHGTVIVGVSQTLRHWTEGAIYIRQGGHHVGHWATF